MTEETKVCSRCKIEKPISLFGNHSWYCKECNSIRCKEYSERKKLKVKNGEYKILPPLRECIRCGNMKPIEDFCWLNKSHNTRRSICNKCDSDNRHNNRVAHKESQMLADASKRARGKGIPFDITVEDIFIPEFCPVLGIPIIKNNNKTSPNSPSLDRIDNTKGYVKGNVCVISWRANKLKGESTIDEMKMIMTYMKRMTHLTEAEKSKY